MHARLCDQADDHRHGRVERPHAHDLRSVLGEEREGARLARAVRQAEDDLALARRGELDGDEARLRGGRGRPALAARRVHTAGDAQQRLALLQPKALAPPFAPTVQDARAAREDELEAVDLAVAGVDIIRSNKGPLVLEVNSSPGLEGIENATGKDLANQMIIAIEKKLGYKD